MTFTVELIRFDTTLSPNGSPAVPAPSNGIVRIQFVIRPTIPSNVIITLTLTAVNGQASTAIAKLFSTSATEPFTAPCNAAMMHNAMFTNPMIQPIRFATVIAMFHSSFDMLPTMPLNAPVSMFEHNESNGLNSQSMRFDNAVWMIRLIRPPYRKR